MPVDGFHSRADIAKKLAPGATTRLTKGDFQAALSLLYDALRTIRKQHPEQMVGLNFDWSSQWAIREWGGVETRQGEHGKGFNRASVAEHVTLALLALGANNWGVAAAEIYTGMAGVCILAAQSCRVVRLVGTEESARHHRGEATRKQEAEGGEA